MTCFKRVLFASGVGLLLTCGGGAYAQTNPSSSPAGADAGTVGEIVVTAEHRTQEVQKVAAAVQVRSGRDLTLQGRYTIAEILEDVPGVTITRIGGAGPTSAPGTGDQQGASIVLRGVVSNTAVAGNTIVPSTATYVDGIYGGIGGDYDINRVEVLLGPQGTLYGRNSTAGVVATHTYDPLLGQLTGGLTAEFGSYSLYHDSGYLNLPVGDQFALRVAGNFFSENGFVSAQGGYLKTGEFKAKALYKPNDRFSVLVGFAMQDDYPNAGGSQLQLVSPTQTIQTSLPLVNTNVDHQKEYWGEIKWDLGFGTLTYLPAYRTYTDNAVAVGTNSPVPGLLIEAPRVIPTDQFLTQELRLNSDPGSKLLWQGGIFYYDNNVINNNGALWQNSGGTQGLIFSSSTQKRTTDFGVFGEATLPIGETWRLTGGVRYDQTKITGTEAYTAASNAFGVFGPPFSLLGPNVISTLNLAPGQGNSTFQNITFKVRVEKDLTPENMLYATVSSGFLPGDVQITTLKQGSGPTAKQVPTAVKYAQETLTAYEIGSKNRFFGNRLLLNADLFYYDYTGYQTSTAPSVGSTAQVVVTTPARMYGGELEAIYQPTPNDRLGLIYAYTNASYVNKPSCPASAIPCFAQVISNTAIPTIAPDTLTLNYDHRFDLPGGSRIDFHADARFSSAYDDENIAPWFLSPFNYEPFVHVNDQWVGDLSATWTSANGKYSLTGYVKNIANNNYVDGVTLAGVPPAVSFGGALTYEPRTLGVIVRANF